MGLFDKLFEKKHCDICGGEIGLLGNRKLSDGNLCKDCAAKLSPWFSDRRQSTVAEIRSQLEYREQNRAAVEAFHTTRTLGTTTKVLLDEDNRKFMVTSASNLISANPDVMDLSQVTGCTIEVRESKSEMKQKGPDGTDISYTPPQYKYSYDFYAVIHVNNPYFGEIRFRLNPFAISVEPTIQLSNPTRPPLPQQQHGNRGVRQTPPSAPTLQPRQVVGSTLDPNANPEYARCVQLGEDIKAALLGMPQDGGAAPVQEPVEVVCPWCDATTVPDANGRCEYCGGELKG